MTFELTPEQQEIIRLFKTGRDLVIEAGAGTGKTSTLVEVGKSTAATIQYVAFNAPIVADAAKKMPGNVRCNTAHSLAMKAVGYQYRPRLDASVRMKSWDIAKALRIQGVEVETFLGEKKWLSPAFLAGLTMRAIQIFCQTADDEPTHRHVPRIDNLDHPGNAERPRGYDVNRSVARALEPALRRAWDDLRRVDGILRFDHCHYLKIWQLSDPTLEVDVILFDEAQDASPVMLDVIEKQTHAQLVYVGDSQQAIYEFTGAINALQRIRESDRNPNVAYLTQSFRFGDAIAAVANGTLARLGAELRLKGTPQIASQVGPIVEPDAILTRTNAAAVRACLSALKAGKTVALVGGSKEIVSFARAAQRLMNGDRVEHAELACFSNWGEVQEYVEQDEQGVDLRLMVKLIDEFGVEDILAALANVTDDKQPADLVVSTAHKSKGREWASVRLADDFPNEEKPVSDAEWRLLYVAVTRAKIELDVDSVQILGGRASAVAPAPVAPIAVPVESVETMEVEEITASDWA